MVEINPRDLLILSKLREDARTKLTKLSKETNVPISTLFDKIKDYKGDLITKFSCFIDFKKLGYPVQSTILVQVGGDERNKLKEFFERSANTNSIYKINNGYNFMVHCIFKSIQDNERFLELIEEKFNITSLQNYYVIEYIKVEEFKFSM